MNNDHKKEENHGGGAALLGLGIAMAIGGALGVMFAPKSGEELRQDTMDKAKEIAKSFNKTRAEVTAMVESIFGTVSDELERNYLEVRGDVLASIEDLQKKGELTKAKYEHQVEKSVKEFSKKKKWTEQQSKKLLKNLQEAWDDIKK
jgi:gas vesicle protein